MSTIQTVISSETINPTSLAKINTNFANLNADKVETSALATKQDTLVSGTNIKTINGVTVLGSGDLTIPALTDGDKSDIVVSGSGATWTVDNGVVTNAKQANMASGTIKGRATVGSGSPEDLTGTQATSLLDVATTSVKGLMSPTDKVKLDGLTAFKLNGTAQVTQYSLVQSNSGTYTTYSDVITPTLSTCAYITMSSGTNGEIWFQKYVGGAWVDMTASIGFGASLTFFPILEGGVSFRFKGSTYATGTSVSGTCNITV